MVSSRFCLVALTVGLAAWFAALPPTRADEVRGVVKSVDLKNRSLVLTEDGTHREITVRANANTAIHPGTGKQSGLAALKPGTHVVITDTLIAAKIDVEAPTTTTAAAPPSAPRSVLQEFWYNFRHNLFKPLLLFFYLGFLVPLFHVKFEFPYVIYQGLMIYLLVAIGWHGGEELSQLDPKVFGSVFGFMAVGFATNFVIGVIAYLILRSVTRLRRIDSATVAGFYGSDSAGTFVTCLGVLGTINIAYDAYMPVMLAVMEIPG